MVGITFFTQFLAMGFTFYSLGIVQKPLADEFSVPRLDIQMIGVAISLGGAVAAPLVGRWVAHGSIRTIMALGCLAMGVGFLLSAQATELWHLTVLFGSLITFAMATMGGVTAQTLVVNWFQENRTVPLGVSMMGISASGAVMAFVTTALVTSNGWRYAFEMFGYTSLCAIPIVWLTVVGRPSERNSGPDSPETPEKQAASQEPPEDFSTGEALRQPNLWIIAIVSGLSFMGTSAVVAHLVAFATDTEMSDSQAAMLASALAAGAAAGKIIFGWIAHRIGEHRGLYVALAAQALGIAGLLLDTPFAVLMSLVVTLGIGLGGVMPLGAALLAHAFGPAKFGPMMGLMMPILIPFQVIGAPGAAAIFDATGSYDGAWLALLGVSIAALLLLTRLDIPAPGPTKAAATA